MNYSFKMLVSLFLLLLLAFASCLCSTAEVSGYCWEQISFDDRVVVAADFL